ncbi:MAG: hypothetical protein HXL58_00535 [Solobacterium sp.]|nr:hypothetical protein [Solobacterium sp.]
MNIIMSQQLNEFIQKELHSDKFIALIEFFIDRYNESANVWDKYGLEEKAKICRSAIDDLKMILNKIKTGKELLKKDADILVKWIERMGVENERKNRNTANKS